MLLEDLAKSVCALQTRLLINYLAILEDHQCRDTHDAVLRAELGGLVHIDLYKVIDLTEIRVGQLLDDG